MQRRNFLKVAAGAAVLCSCGAVGGCKAISGVSDTPVLPDIAYIVTDDGLLINIGTYDKLSEKGASAKVQKTINGKDLKLIIINTGNGYKVFEDRCTHGGRELEYDQALKQVKCVSFGGSTFNMSGKRLSGPAEKDILSYESQALGNEILIKI